MAYRDRKIVKMFNTYSAINLRFKFNEKFFGEGCVRVESPRLQDQWNIRSTLLHSFHGNIVHFLLLNRNGLCFDRTSELSMQLSVGIFRLALEEIRRSKIAGARHTNSVRESVILVNLLTGSMRSFEGNGHSAFNNTYRVVSNGGQHRRKFNFFRRHCLIFAKNRNQVAFGVVQTNARSARPPDVVVDI